ncbi:MAG TPA: alpha/beta hydrolase [Aggregatilineaceae bacterium]|nr:alpha/beta hydrolase [Aggregatilineaceae bacterium]
MKRLLWIGLIILSLGCARLADAQDDEPWTCDGGPNDILQAAKTAYEADDLDLAYQLISEGEALCVEDVPRTMGAMALLTDIENRRLGAVPTPGKIRPTFDGVAYLPDARPDQVLDIFIKGTPAAPQPAVILFRGYSISHEDIGRKAITFAGAGYTAVIVEYREPLLHGYWSALEDGFCAVAWIHANAAEYSIDPNRILLLGFSQGGMLASTIGAADDPALFMQNCPSPVPAEGFASAVAVWGASILAPVADDNLRLTVDLTLGYQIEESDTLALINDLAATPSQGWRDQTTWSAETEHIAQTMPLYWIDGSEPPFLIIHSPADEVVPLAEAETLAAALQNAGVAVDFEQPANLTHKDLFYDMATIKTTIAYANQIFGME